MAKRLLPLPITAICLRFCVKFEAINCNGQGESTKNIFSNHVSQHHYMLISGIIFLVIPVLLSAVIFRKMRQNNVSFRSSLIIAICLCPIMYFIAYFLMGVISGIVKSLL